MEMGRTCIFKTVRRHETTKAMNLRKYSRASSATSLEVVWRKWLRPTYIRTLTL